MRWRKKTIWRTLLITYAILMAISLAVRFFIPAEAALSEGQKYAVLKDAGLKDPLMRTVRIAYFDTHSGSHQGRPNILLLHGSPMAARTTFSGLIPVLSKTSRVIAPDLPGFGSSTRNIPDYSAAAHAHYTLSLLDRLKVGEVHIVAYSMGGAVALNMAHLAPQRVRSITMLSAIGVQEFELLGQYHLNRAIHGLQLAAVWSMYNLIPHMGMLEDFPLNTSYARNFYDTDQRPLRKYLREFQTPMLILHGSKDLLVPLAAAVEHNRIVPQSEFQQYGGGHLVLFSLTERIAEDITDFISKVESGQAATRSGAQNERIRNSHQPFARSTAPPAEGLTLVIIMILIALATLVSEDLTCIGAGLMAARGTIGFVPAVTASFIGIFVGDMLLYLAGKYLGRPALQFPPLKWLIKEKELARTSSWFAARGPMIIITSRFLPGTRLPTYFGAGVLGTGFFLFAFYFSIAAVLWTPILVGLATLIGHKMLSFYGTFQQYALPVALITVGVIWLSIRLIIPFFTFRGRRLLLSRLIRKIHWEFWPPYVFYVPVVFYVIWVGLRRRCLTLFTVTNPGISHSSFVGESKSDILDKLKTGRNRIARYRLIPVSLEVDKRISAATDFMTNMDASFPVVLKPDTGKRGSGVTITHNCNQLETYLSAAETDTIIQEYVKGSEYGIFYFRHPDQERGQLLSITDKRLITLTGDGESTLEQLILKDPRAVCMARFHLKKHAADLFRIPANNEIVQLVDVGTHARGALFLDGGHIRTEAMERAIDDISRGFDGFYFGRYDIRTPSLEDFQKGRNFKIVELKGVTSEATHIYNPGYSLWNAYRVLMRQWDIAVDIGAANRERGETPLTPIEFLSHVCRHQLVRNPDSNRRSEPVEH